MGDIATKPSSDRYGGICECGDHAWARMTGGYVVLVSPEDAHFLIDHIWTVLRPSKTHTMLYAHRKISRSTTGVYLHREILKPIDDRIVDHKFGDGLDNRRSKIRITTLAINAQNMMRASRRNKTGVIGVTYRKNYGTWAACLAVNSKQIWLGSFPTLEAATDAIKAGREKYHAEAQDK